jgi:uncharacterized protein YciI
MTTFAVFREAGPPWADGGIFDQHGVAEHAAFMNALADEGVVLAAGPLGGTEIGRVRVLLIADAESEGQLQIRLADDPWVATDQLRTVSIERWQTLVGSERLSASFAAGVRSA